MDAPAPAANAREVAVVVPAAGRGRRLGGTPKQFRMLGERPLLVQVLLLFEHHPMVGHIVVAVPEAERPDVTNQLRAEGLGARTAVVSGGQHRQASVRDALRGVPDRVEVVLVHDAARPFVSAAQVQEVVEEVRTAGAAALAVPVADTLRRGADERFGDTVSRDRLYRMQTPQGFRRDWIDEAHHRAADDGVRATDDVALVQRYGYDVSIVTGHRRNFKITTPADWALAQRLWPMWIDHPDRLRLSASGSD